MLIIRCLVFVLLSVHATAAPTIAATGCTSTWGRGKLKSYKQVENEIHAKHGRVKILRIVLCGAPQQQFFQVTIINGSGTVKTMQVSAK